MSLKASSPAKLAWMGTALYETDVMMKMMTKRRASERFPHEDGQMISLFMYVTPLMRRLPLAPYLFTRRPRPDPHFPEWTGTCPANGRKTPAVFLPLLPVRIILHFFAYW